MAFALGLEYGEMPRSRGATATWELTRVGSGTIDSTKQPPGHHFPQLQPPKRTLVRDLRTDAASMVHGSTSQTSTVSPDSVPGYHIGDNPMANFCDVTWNSMDEPFSVNRGTAILDYGHAEAHARHSSTSRSSQSNSIPSMYQPGSSNVSTIAQNPPGNAEKGRVLPRRHAKPPGRDGARGFPILGSPGLPVTGTANRRQTVRRPDEKEARGQLALRNSLGHRWFASVKLCFLLFG